MFAFDATNNGNVRLSGISVAADAFIGFTGAPPPAQRPPATLAIGASETCTITYTTSQADIDSGSVENGGAVFSTPPGVPDPACAASCSAAAADPNLGSLVLTGTATGLTPPPAASSTQARRSSGYHSGPAARRRD